MSMVTSKNALPEMGAMFLTISFKVFEIKDRSFMHDGNSSFVMNVRANRKSLITKAIYNAVKREFPSRSVTPYDIIILDYHYTYYLTDYEIRNVKGKYYESYIDFKSKRRKKYLMDRYEIKNNYVGDYKGNVEEK